MTIKLCTYSYVTLRTVPAYFLEQFHEHYKYFLIMFVVTSKVLLYLVWSVSLQSSFHMEYRNVHVNRITMSAGTQEE